MWHDDPMTAGSVGFADKPHRYDVGDATKYRPKCLIPWLLSGLAWRCAQDEEQPKPFGAGLANAPITRIAEDEQA
jgi:hypothetical protein